MCQLVFVCEQEENNDAFTGLLHIRNKFRNIKSVLHWQIKLLKDLSVVLFFVTKCQLFNCS